MKTPLLSRGIPGAVCVVLLCAALLSCGGSQAPVTGQASFVSFDKQAREVLAKMTLEEKVGQMLQPDFAQLQDINDIQTYFLGSVLFGGDSDPRAGNGIEAWTDVYDQAQEAARGSRLGIPLIVGLDAMHGHSNVIGATIFPHNIGLGATNNPELVEEINRITAIEMRATGVHWTFAPCVTVVRDDRWGRSYEGFSEEPTIASTLGAAAVRGLQGADLSDPLSVAACIKHYLADGGTKAEEREIRRRMAPPPAEGATPPAGAGPVSGQEENYQPTANFGGIARMTQSGVQVVLNAGDAVMSEEELRAIHLPPYIAGVEAGAATVMPSYSAWNGQRMTDNKYLLTDVLKGELGFEGFIISDYSAIAMTNRDSYKEAIKNCINAGIDMGMVPGRYREFFTNLKELVEEGEVPMERIDDAVIRILRVKFAMGLMDETWSHQADRSLWNQFGSAGHREVARQAVRESLVLLKNANNTLPLSKTAARIHVAGVSANDIGNQCGGWTIRWQGQSGEVTSGGTTVLNAIRRSVVGRTRVTYSADGTGAEGADVGVVVVGETPYAEGSGDDGDLELSDADKATIANMKAAGMPVVVILFSGRPMVVTDTIDQVDAFIAAWLPGTEGQGIADVLFGDYAPTGKLSFTWPRTASQEPINVGDADYDPLYAFGYGLTY